MSFRLRLKYYLVHTLNYAGKKADELISSERLAINGERLPQMKSFAITTPSRLMVILSRQSLTMSTTPLISQ
jgi:hypothetical protein